MKETKWKIKKNTADIKLMAKTLNISEILANIIANRGIQTKISCLQYLEPKLSFMHDTFKMHGITKAFEFIIETVANCGKIAIYGDYDVDGVISTTILYKSLKYYGADVIFYIPDRMTEGYGLNKNAIQKLKDLEVSLIITCDNGITGLEEVLFAKSLGVELIIIDHHEPAFVADANDVKIDILPEAYAIVNPKQKHCPYPFKLLCAGGICYKFVTSFFSYCNLDLPMSDEFLVLSMISTFCDVVDLVDENRIIARNGLEILNENKKINLGLFALIKEKSLEFTMLESFHMGFILGPCINATGRLERATLAVELFTSEDIDTATEIAKKLSYLNDERKNMTKESVDKAIYDLQSLNTDDKVLVIYDNKIHESIAGIVAGRVKDTFHKPTIVLTDGDDCAKGSARSIEPYNIFLELFECRDLFIKFGGHPMAAGLSLVHENINTLKTRLNENCKLTDDDFIEIIKIDRELSLEDVTYELAKDLEVLSPFGKQNKEPLFGTKGLTLNSLKVIEEKDTIIFTFSIPETFRQIKGICFGKVNLFKQKLLTIHDEYETNKILSGILRNANFTIDIIYYIDINEFNNNISVQMKIKDFRLVAK